MTTKPQTQPLSGTTKTCNACREPLLLENLFVDDGCPCNSPRGVNFEPKSCALCQADNCVKPGHRIKEIYGIDPAANTAPAQSGADGGREVDTSREAVLEYLRKFKDYLPLYSSPRREGKATTWHIFNTVVSLLDERDSLLAEKDRLREALVAAQKSCNDMRAEHRLHGHITNASAHWAIVIEPQVNAALHEGGTTTGRE